MEPETRQNVALIRFARIVRSLAKYKESVLPYLLNAPKLGAQGEEILRRLDAALAELPFHSTDP